MFAAAEKHPEVAHLLVELGADVRAQTEVVKKSGKKMAAPEATDAEPQLINKNQASLSLDPTTPITIGNQTFQASDIGTISGTIGYAKSVAPYIGLGIGGRGRIGTARGSRT